MTSRDDAFDQYAALAGQLDPPPRLDAPARMEAAAARLLRVAELPSARRQIPGPLLGTLRQLAYGLHTAAARHRSQPDVEGCADEACMPAQIADALLGEPIAPLGHGDDGAGR